MGKRQDDDSQLFGCVTGNCCNTVDRSPAESATVDVDRLSPRRTPVPSTPSPPVRREQKLLSFDASLDQPVEGRLIRQGSLLMLDGAENRMKPWTILLFSNGFYASRQWNEDKAPTGEMQSFAWSPFALVREIAADPTDPRCPLRGMWPFSIYLFAQNIGFVFSTFGEHADQERKAWMAAMVEALHAFTYSLFPPFILETCPIAHVASTRSRIMAGYLLRDEEGGIVSVPYCELHAHYQGFALLVLYEDESCERVDDTLKLSKTMHVADLHGASCCAFSLEVLNLCARTIREKQIWIRALLNLKLRLGNDAPDPSLEEVAHWREAVLEATDENYSADSQAAISACELSPCAHRSVRGSPQALSSPGLTTPCDLPGPRHSPCEAPALSSPRSSPRREKKLGVTPGSVAGRPQILGPEPSEEQPEGSPTFECSAILWKAAPGPCTSDQMSDGDETSEPAESSIPEPVPALPSGGQRQR